MAKPEILVTPAIVDATATTTSDPINVAGATRITIYCKRSNHSAGSTAFSLQVSADGTNYVTYNKLIPNLTNTNGQTLTRVASVSLGSNTVEIVSTSPEDVIAWVKVTATETTDGTHNAWVLAAY